MNQPLFGLTTGTRDAVRRGLDFGIDFTDLHFGGDERSLVDTMQELDKYGIHYAPNFEKAPLDWTPSDALKQILDKAPGFLGFIMDEADHMQINAHWPVIAYYGYDRSHYLVETENLDLFSAQIAVEAALQSRNTVLSIGGKRAAVEFLFPVMMHSSAKAGLNLNPKILKETCGPAMLAVAMGAARQYGVDLSIDVDYWWHNETLGHSRERFYSALLLAYWSGADRIYVEGGAQWSQGHPLGVEIEETYRRFLAEYVPGHPRPYNWRVFQPEIAIVRYDDTCFDIRQAYLGEYPGPLFGHIPATAANTEWLNIWSLLSHGFVRTDSLSHQWETRRLGSRSLFVPLHNVAVYDHLASYETLKGLKLIFLSGVTISDQTYQGTSRCVREGATCILPPRLAPPGSHLDEIDEITVITDGKGKWVIVPEFYRLHYEAFYAGPANKLLREVLDGLTGDGDHLVFNFGSYQTRFSQAGGDYPRHEIMTCYLPLTQAGANPDILEVEVSEI